MPVFVFCVKVLMIFIGLMAFSEGTSGVAVGIASFLWTLMILSLFGAVKKE